MSTRKHIPTTERTILMVLGYLSAGYQGRVQAGKAIEAVYLDLLGDLDAEYVLAATRHLVAVKRGWPPEVSEIRETALNLSEGKLSAPSPWDAWLLAQKVGCDNEIAKKAVEAIGGDWEIKHSDNIGSTRSSFIRAYSDFSEAERRERLALPSVKLLAEASRPEEVTPIERRISEPEQIELGTQEEISAMLREAGF